MQNRTIKPNKYGNQRCRVSSEAFRRGLLVIAGVGRQKEALLIFTRRLCGNWKNPTMSTPPQFWQIKTLY
jgi:hypothetical protein